MYAMTGLYAESGCAAESDIAGPSAPHPPREFTKCHSRNPSAGICDRYLLLYKSCPILIKLKDSLSCKNIQYDWQRSRTRERKGKTASAIPRNIRHSS